MTTNFSSIAAQTQHKMIKYQSHAIRVHLRTEMLTPHTFQNV